MSENKKFRIQNGVDIRGEMSFGDQVVVDDSLNITGKTITADTFEGDGSNLTGVVKPSDLNTLIDSDYIQERVVLDGVGIDSADAQLLIDVEKNRAQSAEQVNATAIQSNTNAIDAERQARIEGDQLAVNGRTVQFATLEAMISAEETRATVAEAGLSQDIVDSTSLSLSGDSDLQSQINSIKAGDTEFTGDLIPDQDNVHSLGSETKMWKDVYVGPGSLYINGQKVIEDNSGTITVNADPGQNLSLNTSGGGAIDLNSGDESVQIRSDLIISSSKTISTAGGAATKFGGDVDMQSNQIGNLGVPLQSTDAATKQYVDSVIAVPHTGTKTFDDDVVIGGTLTVKGSTTTIESETLSVADNMVDLNSNMTSGTPTENAGIRVLRGDESPKSFLWKESQGTWSAEGPITATTYYGDGSNLVGIDVYTDADVTALVDSDYVQSRVVIPESGTDSAEVISLIPTQIEAYNSANNVHFSGTNFGIGTTSSIYGTDHSYLSLKGRTGDYAILELDGNTTSLGGEVDFGGGGVRQAAIATLPGSHLTFYTNATNSGKSVTERMRIDASGNVGIGTSTPTSAYTPTLHISGANPNLRLDGTGGNSWAWITANTATAGEGRAFGLGADGSFRITADPDSMDNNIQFFLNQSGNVGIGTSSPSVPLEVNVSGTGDVFKLTRDTGTNGELNIDFSGANANFNSEQGGYTFTTSTVNNAVSIDASGNLLVGKSTSSFTTAGVELAQGGTAGKVQIQRSSSPLTLVNLTDDGNILNFYKGTSPIGAVGVAPGNKMSVIGTNQNLQIGANGTNVFNVSTASVYPDTDNSTNLGFSTSHGRWKHLYLSGSAELGDGHNLSWGGHFAGGNPTISASSHFISFYPEGNVSGETARIDRNGNLLVGLTSGGKFSVSYGGNDTHFGLGANYDNYITAGASGVNIFRNGTTERMRIDASGNVGIGVTSIPGWANLITHGTVAVGGTLYIKQNEKIQALTDFPGGAGNLSINPDGGNVGIGTSSPDSKLQIKGTINSSQLILGGTNNRGLKISTTNVGGQNDSGVIFDAQDTEAGGALSTLIFSTGGAEHMRIDGSGNFMVGATSAFDSSSFCVDQSGLGQFRRDGTPLIIRRDGAYGTLIDFEQDGATVGSITSDAGSVGIGSGNVGLMFYDGGDRIIPRNGTSTSSGVIDLGFSTDRFKDLHLSGTVFTNTGFNLNNGINYNADSSLFNYIAVNGTAVNNNATYKWRTGITGNATGHHYTFSTIGRTESSYVERMRIDASGNVGIGTTSSFGGARFNVEHPTDCVGLNLTADGSQRYLLYFLYNGTAMGSVRGDANGVTYFTTSDRRLKENIESVTDGTEKLMAMNPVTHTWISDPEAPAVHGFIAQEMKHIVPEAVSQDDDPDEMMSMDYGRITPVIVAALQEANKKIAELEIRLNELEGK